MKQFNFSLSTEIDKATGQVLAMYLQVRKGKAAHVRELAGGKALANYNAAGKLLGVELLAPCEVTVLGQLARGEPTEVKQFFRKTVPPAMQVA
jgi:hypothetical protein